MARKRMVTRTIEQTTAKIMCLDVSTAEVTINEYKIGGAFTDAELLTKMKSLYETESFKLVHVEGNTTEEMLLGMTEEDFIRYASVLPPRKEYSDSEAGLEK